MLYSNKFESYRVEMKKVSPLDASNIIYDFFTSNTQLGESRRNEFLRALEYFDLKGNLLNKEKLSRLFPLIKKVINNDTETCKQFFQAVMEVKVFHKLDMCYPTLLLNVKSAGADFVGKVEIDNDLHIEVKSPLDQGGHNNVYMGHDVEKDVIFSQMKKTKNQFQSGNYNLFVFAGTLRTPPTSEQMWIDIIYGNETINLKVNTYTGETVEQSERFIDATSGISFHKPNSKPQWTRISATLVFHETWNGKTIDQHLVIYHNPFAFRPIPLEVFNKTKQWYKDGKLGVLKNIS